MLSVFGRWRQAYGALPEAFRADLGEAGLKKAKLEDTMDSIPPIVDSDTPANVLVPLIRYSKCIMVTKKSKMVGIITASDTLKMME